MIIVGDIGNTEIKICFFYNGLKKKYLFKTDSLNKKIIRNKFKISIENVGSDASNDMEIHYQGCSDKGFCYPMQTFKI